MTARQGLSLLEVIIATAILAASAVMLTSLFATGDRHTARAEQRAIAQMLCETKLAELSANPQDLVSLRADVFPHYPGWLWSVDVRPSSLAGLVQVSVAVRRIAGTPAGADLTIAVVPESAPETDLGMLDIQAEPTFQLTRWLRYEGEVSETADVEADAPLLERLQAAAPGATP